MIMMGGNNIIQVFTSQHGKICTSGGARLRGDVWNKEEK